MTRILITVLVWLCAFGQAQADLKADLNGDCRVDMADLVILMTEWMQEEDCEMALGPELVTNGTFNADLTGWTVFSFPEEDYLQYVGNGVDEGYAAFYANDADAQAALTQTLDDSIASGKTVRISFDLYEYEGFSFPNGVVKLNLRNADNDVIATLDATFGDFGSYTDDILLTDTITNISFWVACSGEYAVSIDNISVREVLSGGMVLGPNLIEDYYSNF